MNSPLLSIGIPTFNRADCLKNCLQSITSQFAEPKVASQVEIVVSDNFSQDHTTQVVLDFQAKFPNVIYKKNQTNFGVDRNILQVAQISQGKFVWFLGDDDALFPGSLQYILSVLENPKADYYIVNCWGYNKSLTEKALSHPNLNLLEDKYYNALSDYVKQVRADKDMVGFFCGLSVQIFLREAWLAVPDKEKYIGTNAIHLHTLMTAMKDRPFGLLAKPLVQVRADNIRWDVFPGLETITKRMRLTQATLLWIIKKYNIKYSAVLLKISFVSDIFFTWLKSFLRTRVLKSQKTRDFIKRFLGKL